MRWEGEVKHAELTPVRVWSKRDEGNFGGRSLFEEDIFLSHHGIPGMKWGVKTKEYIKTGYNTLKRRQAILKMQRKAKAKAEAKAHHDAGYEAGQRAVAKTYFIQNKVNPILAKKSKQEKGRFSDRLVDKAADKILDKTGLNEVAKQYGLDQYLSKAKDFLRDQKDKQIDNLYDYLNTDDGKVNLQKFATFLGKRVSRALGAGERAAPHVRRGIASAGRALKIGAKAAGRGAIKAIKSGYRWARSGGIRRTRTRITNARNTLARYSSLAVNKIQSGERLARSGMHRGRRALNDLLSSRVRRR